jgi:hypothetical protein
MISKSTILNYDGDSFDYYDVAVIDYVNSYHSFLLSGLVHSINVPGTVGRVDEAPCPCYPGLPRRSRAAGREHSKFMKPCLSSHSDSHFGGQLSTLKRSIKF